MRKFRYTFLMLLLLPLVNYAQYTGGNGRGDGSLAISDKYLSNCFYVDGNWSTTGCWQNAVLPASNEIAIVRAAATVDGAYSYADLTIEATGSVTISPEKSLTITGTLTNNAGTSGLVIQSTSGGTGSLIFPSGTPNATVQRYVTTTRWNMVTPSTTGVTVQTFFDASGNDSWLTWFDESVGTDGGSAGAGWEYLTTLSDVVNVGQGYNYYPSANETVEFAGNLQSADLSPTITYTSSTKGYNLIGNPYSSALYWDGTWSMSNVENSIWIWNGSQYQSQPGGLATHYVPVGQGFFVRANASSPSITIPAAKRAHNTQAFLKNSENVINNDYDRLSIKAQNNSYEDNIHICFGANGSNEFDNGFDATKMFGLNEAPQLYIVEQELKQSYDYLPLLTEGENRTVAMSYIPGASGQQQLIADLTYLPETHVTLEDLQTSTIQNLNENPVYVFNGTKDDEANRFLLHFAWSPDGIADEFVQKTDVYIYSYEKDVYIQSEVYSQGEITVCDMLGRIIYKNKYHNNREKIRLNINNSFVVVRVVTQQGVKSEKVYIR